MKSEHTQFSFKPPYLYNHLNATNRQTVNVVENKLLGIRFIYGHIASEEICPILEEYLVYGDYMYVRGHQKYSFLQEWLA